MTPKPALAFLAAVTAGALIWALSPLLTGHTEPWDADGRFYFSALVLAGLAVGALVPRSLGMHYLGAVELIDTVADSIAHLAQNGQMMEALTRVSRMLHMTAAEAKDLVEQQQTTQK